MLLETKNEIEKICKKYTNNYTFYNKNETLEVCLSCFCDEESKEFLLNDLDKILSQWFNFSHTYYGEKLTICFKDLI